MILLQLANAALTATRSSRLGGSGISESLLLKKGHVRNYCHESVKSLTICLYCNALGLRSGRMCCTDESTFSGCAYVTKWYLGIYTNKVTRELGHRTLKKRRPGDRVTTDGRSQLSQLVDSIERLERIRER